MSEQGFPKLNKVFMCLVEAVAVDIERFSSPLSTYASPVIPHIMGPKFRGYFNMSLSYPLYLRCGF